MDSPELHGDLALAKHLLARMTAGDRRVVLATVPEFVAVLEARRMLWLRIGQAGNEPLEIEALEGDW